MIGALVLWFAAAACFAVCWALVRGHEKRAPLRPRVDDRARPSPIAIRFVALNDECAAAWLISRVDQAPAGDR